MYMFKRTACIAALAVISLITSATSAQAAETDVTVQVGDWNCRPGYKVEAVLGTITPSNDSQDGWKSGRYFVVEGVPLTRSWRLFDVSASVLCKESKWWFPSRYYTHINTKRYMTDTSLNVYL